MPFAPSIDIKDMLVESGVGAFGATSGWAIYVGEEPPSPDTCITIYDTGGFDPNPKFLLDFPTIQIRIRGNENGFVDAYNKAQQIKDSLLGRAVEVRNATRYDGIWMTSDITYIGTDDRNRPVFVTNWRIAREPDSGTFRVSM